MARIFKKGYPMVDSQGILLNTQMKNNKVYAYGGVHERITILQTKVPLIQHCLIGEDIIIDQ